MHRLLLGLPALLLIRSRAVTLSCSAHLALKWAPSRSSLHAFRCAGVAKPAAHLKRCRTGPARFRGAPALVGARPAAAPASGGSSAPAATMDHLYDAHGGMYHHQQQTQYILVDEHDHDHGWPAHSAAMPAVHAGAPGGLAAQQAAAVAHHQQAAEPLGPLPSIHGGYPGKPVAPMMPVGLGDDDEATESEGEHARGAALGWVPQQAPQRRPESTLTATSQQPSPTPSVSVARGASGGAPPPPATKAKGGGSKRKPGGKGGITLRLLIEEGVLQPGHNVLSVVRGMVVGGRRRLARRAGRHCRPTCRRTSSPALQPLPCPHGPTPFSCARPLRQDYKGMKQLASLMPDGRISSGIGGQTMVFESPSAFSIYLKRLVNPTRKADDGRQPVGVR